MRFALLSLTLVSLGLAQELAVENPQNPVVKIATNRGEIFIELFPEEAPKTVENFVDLAEGRREFTDPKTGEKLKRPYYDGLTFHRVIEGFMIQGGCPLGDGSGGPGYTFADEINADTLGLAALRLVQKEGTIHPWLLVRNEDDFRRLVLFPLCRAMGILSNEDFQSRQPEVVAKLESISVKDAYENLGYVFTPRIKSRPPTKAVIAMANAGPNTNGSQFFINLDDTPHLTGKHTVFGRVVKGMDVVEAIGKTATDDRDRPTEAVVIESIRLIKP